MSDLQIICPNCKSSIKLTESIAAPLLESTVKEYEDKIKRISLEENEKAKKQIEIDIGKKDQELEILKQRIQDNLKKLSEAQKAQVETLKKQQELDDAKREIDLTVQKKIQEGLVEARESALKIAEENQKLKIKEKEETIFAMQKQIEDLKRRAEQGSQQLQGEVQELELENLFRTKFPYDSIEPIGKGEFGGDILQKVINNNGQSCGSILWESKRTKSWSDSWLSKLKDDQRNSKSEISVIVSQVLPKNIDSFDLIDGVWVTNPKFALPVAIILRQSLIDLHLSKIISTGQESKTEKIYQYLTGSQFKQRIEAIVEAFSSMHEDLSQEKKAIMKHWAKREMQIEKVMNSTISMYGDIQGIAGKSMQEIEGLSFNALEAKEN